MLEGRSLAEIGLLPLLLPALQASPRGDGHPVLLVPGVAASDFSLFALRCFLQSRGYHVVTWGFGQNTGFKVKFSQALEQKVRYLHHRHRRKVSLIGWSLGGVYSFYAAHCAPECVRTVISLGSPLRFSVDRIEVPVVVHALYRYFAHPMGPLAHVANVRAKILKNPPPVPSTCIYSLTDGIVPPEAAQLETDDGDHENISVPGSHSGLGFNPAVMWILADRLAQREGAWRPFEPRGLLRSFRDRVACLLRPAAA